MAKVVDPSDKTSRWMTAMSLCQLIGVSTVSFYKWRAKHDDFPDQDPETHRYNIDEIRAWMDDHPEVGTPGQRVGAKREDLMCENLEKRNKLLEQQIAESEHRLVDGSILLEMFIRERTIARETFRKRILSEIPAEAEGKRAQQIHKLLEAAMEEYDKDIVAAIPSIIRGKVVRRAA
jgi:hypothetical protein